MADKISRARRRAAGQTGRTGGLCWRLLLAFGCGMGLGMLLLALFALLLAKTSFPITLVRPMVCVAAASGAALSGWVLARSVGAQFLLWGLGCGVFYTVCLAVATLLNTGGLPWQGANLVLPLSLLLGGCFGGALAAVRGAH